MMSVILLVKVMVTLLVTLKFQAMSVLIVALCFFAWLGEALNDGGKV